MKSTFISYINRYFKEITGLAMYILIVFSNFASVVRNCHPHVDLELLIEIGTVVETRLLRHSCDR